MQINRAVYLYHGLYIQTALYCCEGTTQAGAVGGFFDMSDRLFVHMMIVALFCESFLDHPHSKLDTQVHNAASVPPLRRFFCMESTSHSMRVDYTRD